EAGIGRLRDKSIHLTGFLESLLDPLAPAVRIVTPRADAARGCQLSLRIAGGPARGKQVFDALDARGVTCDWRAPDLIRIAPTPLYNRFEDVFLFSERLAQVLKET